MNTDRELMQQALEALLEVNYDQAYAKEVAALRERLAQPEQKPVANICTWHKNGEQHAELWNWDKGIETLPDGDHDLYTTPPQRKPLSPDEVCRLWKRYTDVDGPHYNPYDDDGLGFARAIEAAHGIKE